MLRFAILCKLHDIRTFGAVMTTFVKAALSCGQVRGPVQIGFARSIEPIVQQEVTITRVAITTEADAEKGKRWDANMWFLMHCIAEGFVSANLAQKVTGFSEDDLALLWEAVINMFEHDRSAARGKMVVRELIVFKHDSVFGNAPAHKLFETVTVTPKKPGLARQYSDYEVNVDFDAVPAGVACTRMV